MTRRFISFDHNGNVIKQYELEDIQVPLDGLPLMAALNAALGVWSLSDAANIAGVSEQALVDEVTAWAVASADL